MTNRHLILLAHGSTDPDWRAPFEAFCRDLHPLPASLAYMEMAQPTLGDTVAQVAQADTGVTVIDILPLFMAQGGHLKHDVPNQVAAMRQRFGHIQFNLLPPIGQHPLVVAAMREACQAYGSLPLHHA